LPRAATETLIKQFESLQQTIYNDTSIYVPKLGGCYVGMVIDKYNLDRLHKRGLELVLRCPYCKSARLVMKQRDDLDYWEGVTCPKCGSKVVLDSLSLVVMRENGAPAPQAHPSTATAVQT
jgi:DNA-directed RNA polymerase subunit RPC12/RpoP